MFATTAPIDRMIKTLRLAQQGIGGERENAQVILDKMIARYGVSRAHLETLATAQEQPTFRYRRPPEPPKPEPPRETLEVMRARMKAEQQQAKLDAALRANPYAKNIPAFRAAATRAHREHRRARMGL